MTKRLAIFIFVSLVIISPLFLLKLHRSESVESAQLTVDVPYLRVVSSLGKKSSLESMVSSGGGELLDRRWDEFVFDLGRVPRLSSWEMKGSGHFSLLVDSEDFTGRMDLEQHALADRSGVSVESKMLGSCGFVKGYETNLKVSNAKPVVVEASSRIVYERLVPFWMCDAVDERVSEYNKKRLYALVRTIRCIVE